MKNIIIILTAFLLTANVFSQGGWFPLQSGETAYILSIQFIDAQTGYYISTSNACFKTTNGGAQWNLVEIFESEISEVKFVNSATGYITACNGDVYRSTNSGNSWRAYNTGSSSCLSSVFFLNSQTGWVTAETNSVINTVYKTLNGGINWFLVGYVPGIERSYKIQFTDNLTGWVCGRKNSVHDGILFRTTNGGANWIAALDVPDVIEDLYFITPVTGWAVSGRKVFKSTNSGANWVEQLNVQGYFTTCFFTDVNTGWAQGISGSDGIIYKTTNSGQNWSSQTAAGSYNLLTMYFINSQTGWTAGLYGRMYKTTNGGNQFTGVSSNEGEIPGAYSLEQNYPNPFNPATNINFQLPVSSYVKLTVFDTQGREIEILVNEEMSAGTHNISWNASGFASGVYLYRLEAKDYSVIRKMVLIK